MGHYDCKECHQDPVSGHAPDCSRGNTLSTRLTEASVHAAEMAIMYRRGGCSLDANILRLFSEIMGQAADEIASARIKGDKDRENPVERPQLEYDHTQEGTTNFERALSYARSLEIQADLSNSTYAAFMAERGDHLRLLTDLAYQYLSDLRYPPSHDSRDRRIERIEAVLKEVQP